MNKIVEKDELQFLCNFNVIHIKNLAQHFQELNNFILVPVIVFVLCFIKCILQNFLSNEPCNDQ